MTALTYEVPSCSRVDLRKITHRIHHEIGLARPPFPIDRVMDLLALFVKGWEMEIVDGDDLGDLHALTHFEHKRVYVAENVYDRACEGHGRDRLTLAHELGHVMLHSSPSMARKPARRGQIPAYADSEWQANAFAGELLVPSWYTEKFNDESDVMKICGVSLDAATKQLSEIRKIKGRGPAATDLRPLRVR